MLVKKQVRQLENPSLRCVDQVLEELLAIVDYCDKVHQLQIKYLYFDFRIYLDSQYSEKGSGNLL